MIKIYLIATLLFFVILFINFSTIMNQRRFARKRVIKNMFKVLLIGFIVLCGLSFLK